MYHIVNEDDYEIVTIQPDKVNCWHCKGTGMKKCGVCQCPMCEGRGFKFVGGSAIVMRRKHCKEGE